MSQRYHGGVWIDFLHGVQAGQFAINAQEMNERGDVTQVHRKYLDGATAIPDGDAIVRMLIPGSTWWYGCEKAKK